MRPLSIREAPHPDREVQGAIPPALGGMSCHGGREWATATTDRPPSWPGAIDICQYYATSIYPHQPRRVSICGYGCRPVALTGHGNIATS